MCNINIMDFVNHDKLLKELLENKLIELLKRYCYSNDDIEYIVDQEFNNISEYDNTDFEIHDQLFISILKAWRCL